MSPFILMLFSSLLLFMPITGLGNKSYPNVPVHFNPSSAMVNRFYQKSPIFTDEHTVQQTCQLDKNIFLLPDSKFETLSVVEYWKVTCPTDGITSAPQNLPEIQIFLPVGAQKIVLPDNSLGIFQKIESNQIIFTPAFLLNTDQLLEFPLLYEVAYPLDGKIEFSNTLNARRISISLPASEIRIEADGFSYDGKRSIEETPVDVYRSQAMQAGTHFSIHLIRSTSPVTPSSQKTGFLLSLACLFSILVYWYRAAIKRPAASK